MHTALIATVLALSGCGGSSSDPDTSTEGNQSTEGSGEEGSQTGADDDGGVDDNTDNPSASLSTAIQGAWMGSCSTSTDGSSREILAITDTQIVQDFYDFNGTSCDGVPRGRAYPLRIYDYTLGSDVAVADGGSGAELNLVVRQLSNSALFRDGATVDQQRYDIIGTDANGNLLRTRQESTNSENRPASFDGAATFTARTQLTEPALSAQDLVGSYSPGCQPLIGGDSTLDLDTLDVNGLLTTVREYYSNETCVGEAAAATQQLNQYVYGDSFTNIFGDTQLRAMSTREAKTILYGGDLLSEIDLGEQRVRYDAVALIDNTLLRGDCVLRVDDCKLDDAHYADMIDFEFNSVLRFERVTP